MSGQMIARRRFTTWLAAAGLLPLLPSLGFASGTTALKELDGAPAPALALPDLDGDMRDLSQQKGKIIIVNFWATWCPPCKAEMPSMQRAWEAVREEDMDIWAVHVGGPEDSVQQFVLDAELDFPILLDLKGTTPKTWDVLGLPATVVVDGQGRVRLAASGAREWDDPVILDQLRALKT